jgi:hypothetical protein
MDRKRLTEAISTPPIQTMYKQLEASARVLLRLVDWFQKIGFVLVPLMKGLVSLENQQLALGPERLL